MCTWSLPGIIVVALYHDKYTILRVLRQPLQLVNTNHKSTDQDSSVKLESKSAQRLWSYSVQTEGQTDRSMGADYFIVPLLSFRREGGSVQKMNTEKNVIFAVASQWAQMFDSLRAGDAYASVNWRIIDSNNGSYPAQFQAITWTCNWTNNVLIDGCWRIHGSVNDDFTHVDTVGSSA